jgi:hypothetical protein
MKMMSDECGVMKRGVHAIAFHIVRDTRYSSKQNLSQTEIIGSMLVLCSHHSSFITHHSAPHVL